MAVANVQCYQLLQPQQRTMTDNNLATEITSHLKKYGVKLIELHDGTVQFLGKYGTIMLSKDISTLRPKHINELCRLIELIQRRPSHAFGLIPLAFIY
jgi:hypothetical protein